MRLSDIDLSALTEVSSPERWGALIAHRDRRIYRGGDLYYKVWDPAYLVALPRAIGPRYTKWGPNNTRLPALDLGIYDRETAPAFVDTIVDENDVVRGYITRHGRPPRSIDDAFIYVLFARSLSAGWLPCDVCFNNVIEIDGKLSMVDYDSHLTRIDVMDIDFERERGCLRSHIHPLFRHLVEEYVTRQRAA